MTVPCPSGARTGFWYHVACYGAAMFGLSFGELCVLLIVAMVVLGPKELPRYLRKAGQVAGRLRRMAFEMREKSGIDEVLRTEGLDREIAELRKFARGEVMGVASAVRSFGELARPDPASRPVVDGASPYAPPGSQGAPGVVPSGAVADGLVVVRERELPSEGPDAYGALPDTAVVYDGMLVSSSLAEDGLYARGVEAERLAPAEPAAGDPNRPSISAPTPSA
jgi:sec-independent protein translocase protein TatB